MEVRFPQPKKSIAGIEVKEVGSNTLLSVTAENAY
jgi:hypothetical protein